MFIILMVCYVQSWCTLSLHNQIDIRHHIHVIFEIAVAQFDCPLHILSLHLPLPTDNLLPYPRWLQQITASMNNMTRGGYFLDPKPPQYTRIATAVLYKDVARFTGAAEDFTHHWPAKVCGEIKFCDDVVTQPLGCTSFCDFKPRQCKTMCFHEMRWWMDVVDPGRVGDVRESIRVQNVGGDCV